MNYVFATLVGNSLHGTSRRLNLDYIVLWAAARGGVVHSVEKSARPPKHEAIPYINSNDRVLHTSTAVGEEFENLTRIYTGSREEKERAGSH